MKFVPLDTDKPVTNKQLAEGQNKLHDCLHSVGERVSNLALAVAAAQEHDQAMSLDIARIQGALGIRQTSDAAMSAGDPPKPVGRKLAGLGPWQAGLGLMGSMAGAAGLYKIIEPAIIAAAVALRHALLAS